MLLLSAFLTGLLSGFHSFTLNVPNVLLPLHVPNEMYTNFTLSADAGCFNWLSTKELIVGVRPIHSSDGTLATHEGCSREAQLSALSQDTDRQLSLILVEETSTGSEVRVDVFVDQIHRIAIKTTSLELLLEETPSTFEAVAYCSEGNTFSTLDGLQFTWTIEPDISTSGNVLKYIPYTESSYLTPPTIGILENQGKQGDKILIQGINTGVAWVKAKLTHPAYQGVSEVSVRVVVIENLLLNPPYDQWVLPLTLIDYKAERRQHGKKTAIQLPSEQYSLSLSNGTVAEMSGPSSVTSLIVGNTDVILVDKNVQHLPLGTPPHTTLHVVPPESLHFKIKSDNWNFEKGKKYSFSITVFGPNNRPVLLTDNIRIQLVVEDEYLRVVDSNMEGTEHTVQTTSTGTTTISATLHTLTHPRTGEEHPLDVPVSNSQSVVIRLPVTVTPVTVILPLYKKQPYTFRLTGGGGSGEYTWSTPDKTRVTVTQEGDVTGRKEGRVGVTASDVKNGENSATSQVIVAELSGLQFLPARVEAIVGSTLTFNLAAYIEIEPGKRLPFTRCDMVPLDSTLSNDVFEVESESEPVGDIVQGVCRDITVRGKNPGISVLKTTYTTSKGVLLSATITIATYLPLSLTNPSHTPVLSLGSSIVLELSGGPAAWPTAKSGYSQTLECGDEGCSGHLVSHKHTTAHHFRVTCHLLGIQSGLVVVGNKISQDNPFPAMETVAVAVRCEVPGTLELSHTLPTPPPECPLSDEVSVMIGSSLVTVFSVKTPDLLPFDNSSSLLFQFAVSDNEMMTLDSESVSGVVPGESDSTARATHVTGSVTLTLTVEKYDSTYFTGGIVPPLDVSLQQSLMFQLVKDLTVSPPSLTMFNYEDTPRELVIDGGSGHFLVSSDHQDVVKMTDVGKSPIIIKPHLQGAVILTVQDLCLPGQIARSNVHVTGPAEVQIKSVSQVQIHNSVLLTLTIIDSNQRKISSEVFGKLDLQHVVSTPPHVTIIAASDQSPCDQFCAVYRIDGITLGTSTVQFIVAGEGQIHSNTISVTVFPPLTLLPSPLVLVEGAVFQLRFSGGPKYDSSLHFSSLNHTTALINQRALVTGVKTGKVDVMGSCVGIKSESNEIYGEASVTVEVIQLRGIEIRTPSTYIIERSEIPLTVWGADGNNPFTFASVTGITFAWKSSSTILLLNSVYKESGYSVTDEKQFTITVSGVEQGIALVTVVATYQDGSGNTVTHTDSISIQVIKKAILISPHTPLSTPSLLLAPGATYSILTNKDHTHTLHYTTLSGKGVVSLSSDGVIRAEGIGSVTLKIDVVEDHNINQTLLLHIQVKSPFSILITESAAGVPPAETSPDYSYYTLPVGILASFSLFTLDDLGRKFDSVTKTSYHYTMNRMDVVSVESVLSNNTLTLTGLTVGEAIIRVYSESGLEGWLYVRVSSPLDIPVFTLLRGTSACLAQLLQDDEGGEWSSADVAIATVQGTMVTGNGLGVTELRKQITSSTHSILKIDVVKIESVTVSAPVETRVLSNIATPRTTSKVVVPVTMTTTKPLSPLPAKCDSDGLIKVVFQCSTSDPSVVSVTPDLELGVCVVSAVTDNPVVGGVSPLITVHAGDGLTSSIKIPFVQRFKLSMDKIPLSPSQPTADLALLEGDLSLIQILTDVGTASEDVNIIKTSTHFHMALLNWNTESQHSITFVCGATGQQEVVEVSITPATPPSPSPVRLEFSTLAGTVLPTAVLGLLVLLTITGIVFLTTASYKRLCSSNSTWGGDVCGSHVTMVTTPVKTSGSPFRPATISPIRHKTPLYTKPRGTPGAE